MNTRQNRIMGLARQNRVRIAAPLFLGRLSAMLGETVNEDAVLTPESADQAIETFRSGYRNTTLFASIAYRKFFRVGEQNDIYVLADCLAQQLRNEEVLFLTDLNGDTLATRVNAALLLLHSASLISFDGDSLSILSNDCTQGILVDRNPDDSERAYEFVVWGNGWSTLMPDCERGALLRDANATHEL